VRIHLLTLFPEYFAGPFSVGVVGRAAAAGLLEIEARDLRQFGKGAYRQVDDAPFGGGPGMIMMVEPIVAALEALRREAPVHRSVLLSASGRRADHALVAGLAAAGSVAVVCGRYEGVDERVRAFVTDEVSVADVVLAGGEAAAVVLVEAMARLVPGVLGNEESLETESFASGLLEHPQYTRPAIFRGLEVPEVLLSGDHARIARWRRVQAAERTRARRPDLLDPEVRSRDAEPSGAPSEGGGDGPGTV